MSAAVAASTTAAAATATAGATDNNQLNKAAKETAEAAAAAVVATRLRESRNSVFSTCNLVTETELQLLFIGMINSDRVNNVTRYYALRL